MLRSIRERHRIAFLCSLAPLIAGPQAPQSPAKPIETTKPQEKEALEYSIEWRLISAGRAKLSLGPASAAGKAEIESKLHLESLGLVSRLFHVEDNYSTQMTRNFCAESTFMSAREAGRHRETRVVYDDSAKKATYQEKDLIKNTSINAETSIPPCVHDVIGGLYALRALNLEPGKSVQLPVSDGKKSVMLKIESQRREDLKTALGPKKTVLYEIYAFNNVLFRRPGRLHVWLTDDAQKIPVQIQIRLQFTIGTVTLRLDKEEKT